jgi:hypothetical protein
MPALVLSRYGFNIIEDYHYKTPLSRLQDYRPTIRPKISFLFLRDFGHLQFILYYIISYIVVEKRYRYSCKDPPNKILYISYKYHASKIDRNKTENAFSPLPARTKASNADMTACLSAITRLHCPDYKTTGLRPEISTAALQSS